ncbi:MAG: phosphoribosyl-AMP cyclohydrolase [Acidobacteriales bacterium]|nr:phosphoribosyl-AMP cyclohydrolase [Terriglobales bacterium]
MTVKFEKLDGLAPAVVQDWTTGEILMVGFMNEEALQRTQATREVTFYSRSRGRLWVKGETSGHRLRVRELRVDCDGDAILTRVEPTGPGVCHEGYRSCFFRQLQPDGTLRVIAEPAFSPKAVYGEERKP